MQRISAWCLACCCVLFLGADDPADPAREVDNVAAANGLRNLGAVVRSDEQGFIREISFAASKAEEDVTLRLRGLKKVEVLDLSGMKVSDESLKNLKDLTNLELLVLARTQITDTGLQYLASLTKLSGLDLSGTKVTGSGLVHIQKLENLSDLLLDRTQLSDEHLMVISQLPTLTTISLIGVKQVTPQGLTKLKRSAPKLIVLR